MKTGFLSPADKYALPYPHKLFSKGGMILKRNALLLRRRAILHALTMVAAVVIIFWAVNTPSVVGVSASRRELPVYCVQQKEKIAALSFDAAWGNEDTQTLIDILNQYGINTTFFVVGDWVDRYPESVRALAEAGNEVMNHSSSHAHFSSLSSSEITADISACNDKIEAVTGIRPTLFRCPYGEYDDHVIKAVNSLGMTAVQWDVDSLDWKNYGVDSIVSTVLNHPHLGNGSIILMHNGAKYTKDALPLVIDGLQKKGFEIVPISQLIYQSDYEMDHEGRQHLIHSNHS